jgi:hypothetical protein
VSNLLPVSLTPVANLPLVSTMLAKMVEKCATDVIDTGGAPLLANISAKKFETVLMEYSGAGGKLITEKNQKRKILWHYPFKSTRI